MGAPSHDPKETLARAPLGATDGVEHEEETLGCYSELYSTRALVYAPADLDELRTVLARAVAERRRVTFRAGGNSLDAQALGDDVVVSLCRLDGIAIDVAARKLTVGPGARWGDVLARLERHGLVPAVTVTTARATAGGTLSGDCLSRFSPAYGKEGHWVDSFELLTLDGRVLTCRPPRRGVPWEDLTLEERAFSGVVGGLGWLGAVISITYTVLYTGETDGRVGVRSIVRKYGTYAHLARDLVPAAKKTSLERSDPRDPEKLDGIYSAVHTDDAGVTSAILVTSAFTTTRDRKRMALHQPELAIRPLAEALMRWSWLAERVLWPLFFRFAYRDGEEFVDDLGGYTFFMDGNYRAKDLAASLGFTFKTVQQTFVVPSDPGALGGWDKAKDDLVEWLEHAHERLLAGGARPTLQDVLYLPADDPFLLSATAGLAGFAVTYAFETSDEARIATIRATLTELADTLWDKFGGRVYLVKNVCVRPETLAKMYGANAERMFALKAELDPGLVLRNDFLERTFGALARASRGGA